MRLQPRLVFQQSTWLLKRHQPPAQLLRKEIGVNEDNSPKQAAGTFGISDKARVAFNKRSYDHHARGAYVVRGAACRLLQKVILWTAATSNETQRKIQGPQDQKLFEMAFVPFRATLILHLEILQVRERKSPILSDWNLIGFCGTVRFLQLQIQELPVELTGKWLIFLSCDISETLGFCWLSAVSSACFPWKKSFWKAAPA